jgi:hypothetical protein
MIKINDIDIKDEKELYESSESLNHDDLVELIKLLNEKDNDIRYKAFRLLEKRSLEHDDVYHYFDVFALKLINNNSYQRSIGLMLIAANAKWDKNNKIENIINSYLSLCNDEKPITIRQCLQSLLKILPYKENLWFDVVKKLISMDLKAITANMRKSICIDMINVLKYINSERPNPDINKYFDTIINSDIFDSKTIKELMREMDSDTK